MAYLFQFKLFSQYIHLSQLKLTISSSFSSTTIKINGESLFHIYLFIFSTTANNSLLLKISMYIIYVETFSLYFNTVTAMIPVLAAINIILIIIYLIFIISKHIRKTPNGRKQQGGFKVIVKNEHNSTNITYTENISNEKGSQDIELEINEVSSMLS